MKLKRTTDMLRVAKEMLSEKDGTRHRAPLGIRTRRMCVNLALTTRTMENIAVVNCRGKLVFKSEAEALCLLVASLVRQYRSVVLDLAEIAAIDADGIGTLAKCIQSAHQAGARIVFCNVPKKVKSVLDLTHVSSVVEFAGSEAEAVKRSLAAA